MEKDTSAKKQPDPARVQIIKMLPREVKESLTIEETNAILYDDVWPDSLQEKLKDYLVD
ncbi:MAG: hypothetical protein AB1390_11750 [Nitrospirota bacterium]